MLAVVDDDAPHPLVLQAQLDALLWAQVGLCHCLAARTEGSGRASLT